MTFIIPWWAVMMLVLVFYWKHIRNYYRHLRYCNKFILYNRDDFFGGDSTIYEIVEVGDSVVCIGAINDSTLEGDFNSIVQFTNTIEEMQVLHPEYFI